MGEYLHHLSKLDCCVTSVSVDELNHPNLPSTCESLDPLSKPELRLTGRSIDPLKGPKMLSRREKQSNFFFKANQATGFGFGGQLLEPLE